MKVRTHVLILMLISFGGSCLLGTLAFWTYSHYNNKRKELDDATFQILDEGIFSLAKSFTKSVREYITRILEISCQRLNLMMVRILPPKLRRVF